MLSGQGILAILPLLKSNAMGKDTGMHEVSSAMSFKGVVAAIWKCNTWLTPARSIAKACFILCLNHVAKAAINNGFLAVTFGSICHFLMSENQVWIEAVNVGFIQP